MGLIALRKHRKSRQVGKSWPNVWPVFRSWCAKQVPPPNYKTRSNNIAPHLTSEYIYWHSFPTWNNVLELPSPHPQYTAYRELGKMSEDIDKASKQGNLVNFFTSMDALASLSAHQKKLDSIINWQWVSSFNYESFICKSSFLHSPSWAIKKNVRLGRLLYNTLFRGIGNVTPHLRSFNWSHGWSMVLSSGPQPSRLNECARTRWKVSNSFKTFLDMHYMY